jgi:vacuolar-type H+-ATPase subunit D/Vma8
MDTLCEQIDKLTINYLEEFGHLIASKQILDDTIKQGYFNLSRARVIMGVNNLSRLQYSEKDPMIASTKISISSDPFAIEKETDHEHADDALKWFGLLSTKVLKQSQKSFQQTIDLALEVCQRQDNICQLKNELEQLLKEKNDFLTKENLNEEKNVD